MARRFRSDIVCFGFQKFDVKRHESQKMSERERKIDEFLAITGASREIADSLLNVCNDNLEMAINMHMEGVQTEEVGAQNQPGTSSAILPAIDEGKSFKIFTSDILFTR